MASGLAMIALIVLATQTQDGVAKNLKSLQKDDSAIQARFPLWSALKECVEACPRDNVECPMRCLKDIAGKDEAAFDKFLKEGQVVFQGIFCMAGCVATGGCQVLDASKFSLSLPSFFSISASIFIKINYSITHPS